MQPIINVIYEYNANVVYLPIPLDIVLAVEITRSYHSTLY